MNKKIIKIRVRYGETDQMGIVHHSNYAQYFELARIRWLENLGASYKKMEEEGIMLPVYEMKIKYKKPAFFDEIITVETSLEKNPTAKIVLNYVVRNSSKEILTQAQTTLVFTDAKTKKPMRCPEYILKLLNSEEK